ncbi:bifunctional DNA primase/polymerase [Thiothrix subterranea]|uniref:bifunctional DNA primase/polymerase n=1 Tax=Thiothrix subterranea TaxID=2735563 RepID=UPI00280C216B|nr:bifunctional DNA primase/polymerase [Thiothrix subterranea]
MNNHIDQTTENTTLNAALNYIAHGFPVFPLRKHLKTPLPSTKGFKDASLNPEQVQQWFSGNEGYNIGIATGNGLVVIDLDTKKGVNGLESLAVLEQTHGQLPPTLTALTPSGGEHRFYRYHVAIDIRSNAGQVGKGIDIRANGGYVVGVPSHTEANADKQGRTATGTYRYTNPSAAIADLPTEWLALLVMGKKDRKPQPERASAPEHREYPHDKRLAELQDALTHIDPQPHDDWVKVGMALYSLGNEGLSLWERWSSTANNYDPKEIPKRWKSFNNTAVNVESVFHMAAAAGWQNPAKGRKPDRETRQPPPDSGASPTSIIDTALTLAEEGDFSGILSTAFTDAVRKVRAQDNDYYLLKIKSRLKKLKAVPITLGDLDKLTAPPKQPKQRYTEQTDDSDGGQPRQGKADLFIEMVNRWANELFMDESGRAYASFMLEPINPETGELMPAHRQVWALESKQFRGKASKEFRKRFGTVAGETAMKEALDIIAAEADESPRQPVYLRYAPIPDNGGVYVDLCSDLWEVVEITPQGWRVIPGADCKVKFRRAQNSKPLPTPEHGGAIADFWQHVNIPGEDSRLLVLAWLLDAMRVNTHYPVLELIAGQGSAKSTTQERLRALIDPNTVSLRIEPRSNQDLSVSAISNHVISLNNLSHLSTATQDFMCSISTGGGDAARKLYTTDDEAAWDTKRPIVMNGINQLVTRPDLADRTICIELPKIEYVDDATLTAAWEQDYPS